MTDSFSAFASEQIERFNKVLVDYVSYGHFRFLTCCEPEAHQLVALERITQQAVAFSE